MSAPHDCRRLFVVLISLSACGQMSAARKAYEEGAYSQAERLADQRVRAHPEDGEAKELRQRSREKVLARMLLDLQGARARNNADGTLALLGDLLQRRRTWDLRLSDADEAALAGELERGREIVRGEVTPLLARGRALAAEARLDRRRGLLEQEPALAALGGELRAQVKQAGTGTCAALVQGARPEEPYWSRLAGRYCAHFGASGPSARLTGLFGGLGFVGGIEGLAPAEQASLQQRLNAAFAQTPWYDRDAPSAGARLTGRHQVRFSSRVASRTRNWTVRVPYSETEYYNASHQVPYQATEYYTVQVPHTTYQSYSYSCGYGTNARTCTGSRPVTSYRSESRTRSVTRYRTEFQRKSRMVTKYRSEPRSASYSVTEHLGAYATILSAAVNLGSGTPAVARSEAGSELVRETSDYAWAALTHTTPLPSAAAWLETRIAAMEGALVWELRKAWFTSTCNDAAPTREQAARCVHGAADPPEPVRAALAADLHEDAPRLLELAQAPAR